MKREAYKRWLEDQKYDPKTVNAQLHRAGRVDDCYGDLDAHFANGTLQTIIDEMNYSADDERRAKPNPSKIPFQGNPRTNLASYKDATKRYRKFLIEGGENIEGDSPATLSDMPQLATELVELSGQKLSLERDMQAALRRHIERLGATLTIIDDGAERSVHSGFIDITCRDDRDGALVVIELKAGKADSRAIGQILGYMGDLAEEEEATIVRGILVAHEFDKRSQSAARVVPSLSLIRYAVEFSFVPQD